MSYDVKLVRNKAVSLFEVKEINIALQDSEQWKQAFQLADEFGIAVPDLIEHIPVVYEDAEMTKPVGEEHILSAEREGKERHECIAVICSCLPNAAFPGIPEVGGIGYQFLYKSDQLYVMNSQGATIHAVK